MDWSSSMTVAATGAGLSLEERAAAFESYIIRKVKEQVETAIAAASIGRSTAGPSPNASRDTGTPRKGGVPTLAGMRIAVEAAKGRAAALEHRQLALEAKVNALVTDFVLTNQAMKHEMTGFGADLTRKYRALQKAVAAAAPHSASSSAVANGHSPALGKVMMEQQESGLRMREFLGVVSLMRQEMEEDRQALRESEAQSHTVMERIIERVNAMDEDIVMLIDRQDAFEGVCKDLRQLTESHQERIVQLEQIVHHLRRQEGAQSGNEARLTAMVDTAYTHQKSHESAVSQKLLTLSARIEQLANTTIELDERCAVLQRVRDVDEQQRQVAAQVQRRRSADWLHDMNRQRLRAEYYRAWRSWQSGCDQARRDQLVLKLFSKQKAQLEDLQRKLGGSLA